MPGRALLAARLRKASTDTVDRALKELIAVGAVTVEPRRDRACGQLTNRYLLPGSPPGANLRLPWPQTCGPGRRIRAAQPKSICPEQKPSPPPVPPHPSPETAGPRRRRLASFYKPAALTILRAWRHAAPTYAATPVGRRPGGMCGGWPRCCMRRSRSGTGRPGRRCRRCWRVAANPATRSPMRLAEAGPWWDAAHATSAISRAGRSTAGVTTASAHRPHRRGAAGHPARCRPAGLRPARGGRVHAALRRRVGRCSVASGHMVGGGDPWL